MQDSIEPTPQAPTASPAPADVPEPAGAVAPVPVAPAGGSPSATPTAGATVARPAPASLVGRLLAVLKREPVLFISLSYILVSFFGIWSTYWFYRTLGLPILRTSVDHGTAFDIAGKGIANADSLVDAAEYAVKLLEGQRRKRESQSIENN